MRLNLTATGGLRISVLRLLSAYVGTTRTKKLRPTQSVSDAR